MLICGDHRYGEWGFIVVIQDQIIARSVSQKVSAIQSTDSSVRQLNLSSAFHTLTHTITLERDPGPFAQFVWNNRFMKLDTQDSFSKAIKDTIKVLILLLRTKVLMHLT